MKEPSPLVPQGSFEAMARGKSHVRIAFYTIVAVHLLVIGGLLILGCKRDDKSGELAGDPGPSTNELTATPPFGSDPAVVAPVPEATDPNLTPPPPIIPPTVPPVNTETGLTTIPPVPPPITPDTPPQPPETAPVEATTREHTIVKGDTFALLASRYGVSVRAIQSANPGVDPTRLKIGQKIKVPASSPASGNGATAAAPNGGAANVYVVKSGDNLGRIASRNGTTVRELQRLNNLATTQIRVGQKLKLPARPAPDGGVAPAQ